MMASLARALDPAGLMYITLPSRSGQETARALRQAVDALVPVASHVQNSAERFQVGVELVQALHHDHPIRHRIMDGRVEGDAERFVADCLADSRDWTYHEAVALMTEAGLRPLYLATPWRWRSDRVFASNDLTEGLQVRLDNLDADSTGLLIDALDASILDGEYRFYACHSSHEPLIPTWVSENREPAKRFDHLVPHRSELMTPLTAGLGPTNGRMLYRSVSGTLSELDRWSSLLLEAADGSTSCGEIEKSLSRRARASDDPTARHQRWIDLAEGGLIFLEDPRT